MQIRDWIYVDDHCEGIWTALTEGEAGEVYNVGGGNEEPNLEITRRILELTGRDESLIRHVADRPGHDRRYALDTTRLRGAGLGAALAPSRRRSRRPSPGTATTAAGGSRSRAASTGATTRSSTGRASRHATGGTAPISGRRAWRLRRT